MPRPSRDHTPGDFLPHPGGARCGKGSGGGAPNHRSMRQESNGADVAEELRERLDAAHDVALRAVHEADARAARADRSARAQRVRAAAAIEVAAEELATLAATMRDADRPEEPVADPLDRLSAEIDAVHPEPAREPPHRPRPAASRRASLHDSPIASMFQASLTPPHEPEASAEPHPEPLSPPEPPEAVVVRARPGLVETWRRRVAAR